MDDTKNEPEVEEEETPESELTAVTDWEAEAKKARGIAQRLRTKLTKATEKKVEAPKTNELDNADYALLAAKGIEEDEDIEFIHQKMVKWEKSLREMLKDEDVLTKLKAMKIERDVKGAMPSSTKRTGAGAVDNLDYWKSKYEQTGELPDDFALRSAVVNAKYDRMSGNTPSWR